MRSLLSFLIATKTKDKSINELGKGIYNTYKSKYELYEKFNKMGILEVKVKKFFYKKAGCARELI